MTNEEINIAIAEVCGWKRPDSPDAMKLKKGWTMPEKWWLCPKNVLRFKNDIPDYCNDLNAMHEAEKVLNDCEVKWGKFRHHLMPIIERTRHELHATARQRAEALLKTLNLWKA